MASINELQEVSLGLTDKAVGLTKEAIGTLLNQRGLTDSGRAQQDKGSARLEAISHEVKADAARAKAAVKNQVQRANQDHPGKTSGKGRAEFSKSGPAEVAGGLLDRVKGQAKEAVGAVTDDSRLRQEGEAQHSKGEARTQAAREEGRAEASRAKVQTADARQRFADSTE